MNDQEAHMLDAQLPSNLTAHRKAMHAAALSLRLVKSVPNSMRSLQDQVIRAAASVPANLSEGHGRRGRDRAHFWRIAYGSAKEVDTFLRLLADAGVIETEGAQEALDLFDEVRAMTWRLLHPTP